MIKHKILISVSEKDKLNYINLPLSWFNTSKVENAIIDVTNNVMYNLELVLVKLIDLGCRRILVRIKEQVESLDSILKTLIFSDIYSLSLILHYNNYLQFANNKILNSNIIEKIIVYSSNFYKCEKHEQTEYQFCTGDFDSVNCGKKKNLPIVNIKFFTESKVYNNCLNKKVVIDEKGKIKNCPNMENSFGDISKLDLGELIEKDCFNHLWKLNKDKIVGCKDCILRYACLDCRCNTIDNKIDTLPFFCDKF